MHGCGCVREQSVPVAAQEVVSGLAWLEELRRFNAGHLRGVSDRSHGSATSGGGGGEVACARAGGKGRVPQPSCSYVNEGDFGFVAAAGATVQLAPSSPVVGGLTGANIERRVEAAEGVAFTPTAGLEEKVETSHVHDGGAHVESGHGVAKRQEAVGEPVRQQVEVVVGNASVPPVAGKRGAVARYVHRRDGAHPKSAALAAERQVVASRPVVETCIGEGKHSHRRAMQLVQQLGVAAVGIRRIPAATRQGVPGIDALGLEVTELGNMFRESRILGVPMPPELFARAELLVAALCGLAA